MKYDDYYKQPVIIFCTNTCTLTYIRAFVMHRTVKHTSNKRHKLLLGVS